MGVANETTCSGIDGFVGVASKSRISWGKRMCLGEGWVMTGGRFMGLMDVGKWLMTTQAHGIDRCLTPVPGTWQHHPRNVLTATGMLVSDKTLLLLC